MSNKFVIHGRHRVAALKSLFEQLAAEPLADSAAFHALLKEKDIFAAVEEFKSPLGQRLYPCELHYLNINAPLGKDLLRSEGVEKQPAVGDYRRVRRRIAEEIDLVGHGQPLCLFRLAAPRV